ncbi:MAG: prolipoprotein diacylglyceryl transferase [Chloroflexi bacterium]|uniref:prolipoprotein diacylglyceryl transferase n=1 Tax=Candidatus Flexifilum breve TaxID=3140694 RepID=UPI00313734F8|nr:prolipoprotein diacylglyceryl transferase [Chloroflexota bacterium]
MEFQSEYIVLFDRLQIRYYGIIIVVAMLVAATIAARLAKRDGRDPDHVWGALTWAIIPAIILSRLWFIFTPSRELLAQGMDTAWFFQNFFNTTNGAIAIWSGGLSIFGAVLGGFLGAYIYMRRNKLPVAAWLDIAGVVLPLGQAIGRIANYVNQELYGTLTTLPWGITIDADKRVAPYKSLVDYPVADTRFHPLFLYEMLLNIVLFVVLLNLFSRRRKQFRYGDFFLIYLMAYSIIRFFLEFLRADIAYIAGTTINSSQAMTVVVFVIALAAYVLRRNQPTAAQTTEAVKQQ